MWSDFVSCLFGSVFILQGFFTDTVSAIRCFQCNSNEDPYCGALSRTDIESPYLQECQSMVYNPYDRFAGYDKYNDFDLYNGYDRHDRDDEYNGLKKDFFCRTIVQKIKVADNLLRVTRSCGWVQNPKVCYKTKNEDREEEVCQCFEDGCNASRAEILSFNLWLIGFVFFVRMLQ